MKIKLTEYDLKTLKQDEDKTWSYYLNKNVKGSEIKTKEEALKHAEDKIKIIVKSILKK